MIDEILKKEIPSAVNFFENAIEKNRLYHSYLLTGNNTIIQYALALNLAREFNCLQNRKENCQCLNCNWIRSNTHPAVMTISPIDFVHVNDKGKKQIKISVNQADFVKKELSKTSEYHRVIIFTNAKDEGNITEEYENLKKYNVNPPVLVDEKNTEQERIWSPKPLTRDIFNEASVNKLLKIVEEPPENVTFFFLTNSTEDMLETITSRCQVVHIPSSFTPSLDYSVLEKIIKNYPTQDKLKSIILSEYIKTLSTENSMPYEKIFDLLQCYFDSFLKNNPQISSERTSILIFLNKLEIAKKQLQSHVNEDSVLENLFF